jgi:hypothetical protein
MKSGFEFPSFFNVLSAINRPSDVNTKSPFSLRKYPVP